MITNEDSLISYYSKTRARNQGACTWCSSSDCKKQGKARASGHIIFKYLYRVYTYVLSTKVCFFSKKQIYIDLDIFWLIDDWVIRYFVVGIQFLKFTHSVSRREYQWSNVQIGALVCELQRKVAKRHGWRAMINDDHITWEIFQFMLTLWDLSLSTCSMSCLRLAVHNFETKVSRCGPQEIEKCIPWLSPVLFFCVFDRKKLPPSKRDCKFKWWGLVSMKRIQHQILYERWWHLFHLLNCWPSPSPPRLNAITRTSIFRWPTPSSIWR